MEGHVVKATARWVRMAPRKVRHVADVIRGKRVDEAGAILSFVQRRAVLPVKKVLNSAVDQARQAGNFDLDNLYVKEIYVDKGPSIKRTLSRARGMVNRIDKFTSHITVVLGELD